MTNSKFKILFVALFAIGLTLTSCGNKSNNSAKTEQTDKQGKEHDNACPMHPEITGAKGDKCSKCGMDLTATKGEDHEEHNH